MYIKGLYELRLSVQALKDKLAKIIDEMENMDTHNDAERASITCFEFDIEELKYFLTEFEKRMKEVE